MVKHARAARSSCACAATGRGSRCPSPTTAIGFDPEARPRDGFGLAGMRERVELAGGELSVLPGADAGTIVRARLPLG